MLNTPTRLYGALGIVIIIILALFAFRTTPAAAKPAQVIEVKWLLSHQPVDVFARAAEVFADELSKNTDGRLALKIVTPQDIGYGAQGDIPNAMVISQLDSGNVQLASAYTVALARTDAAMSALTLPYLFDTYAQTGPVLDGPVGMRLLDSVGDGSSTIRALAFTMSGGYRIIAAKDKEIRTPSDLKGLHIATSGGPVAEATLKALGSIPVPVDLESGSSFDPATIDAVETTYSRLGQAVGMNSPYTSYINETEHSMFLTAILSSKKFYDSLSVADQEALQKAALTAAAVERQDSISLGEKVRSELQTSGSSIVTLTSGERNAFKTTLRPVYDQFSAAIGNDIITALLSR